MAKGDRLLQLAQAKTILPAAGATWLAASAAHLGHVNTVEVGLGATVVAVVSGSTRARPLTWPLAAAGAWVTAATAVGPLAGPYAPLTITWSAAAIAALIAAHRHPSVRAAKARRAARLQLIRQAHVMGIRGAHMIEHELTRLGERWVLDITDTGKLASAIVHSGLAERIAQMRKLPRSRVRVTEHRLAPYIVVSIRTKDPWAHAIPHPLFDPEPEIELPGRRTITQPFPVGQDPESGDPLNVVLWDKIGAKVVMVVGKRGAGKDVLLNSVRERVTAAEDADLWEINVSKAQEENAWAEACEYAACGEGQYKKACWILAAARQLVVERGNRRRSNATFRPTKTDRLKVLIINEIDALLKMGDPARVREQLQFLTSKARSEGVALIIVGQRAIAPWIGGTNVKANVDLVAVGKVQNVGETIHAVGRLIGTTLPDMASYGEGAPGVWCIVNDGGNYEVGRTFELPANGELDVLYELARERAFAVPVLAGVGAGTASGLPASNLPAGNHSPGDDLPHNPEPAGGGDGSPSGRPGGPDDPLERWVAESMPHMPDDLRGQLDKIADKNQATKKILDEPGPARPPGVDQEALTRSAEERWRQAGEQAIIPDDQRLKLLGMLAGDGTTIKEVTAEFKISFHVARTWLENLRNQAPPLAEVTGAGRARRWRRPETTDGDDAPCV